MGSKSGLSGFSLIVAWRHASPSLDFSLSYRLTV